MPEIKDVLSGALITIVIAIAVVVVIAIVATGFETAFPDLSNPFETIFNTIRSITLFLIMFGSTIALLLMALTFDIIADVSGVLGHEFLGLTDWGDSFDFVGQVQIVLTQLELVVTTFFPPLTVGV